MTMRKEKGRRKKSTGHDMGNEEKEQKWGVDEPN